MTSIFTLKKMKDYELINIIKELENKIKRLNKEYYSLQRSKIKADIFPKEERVRTIKITGTPTSIEHFYYLFKRGINNNNKVNNNKIRIGEEHG